MPNYAQPTFIWRLETRLMISRTMRMVELAKGVGAIFQGKEKATNKSRHCLTGNLPICISYPQVNKDFWLWGNNCSNVILNKLMTVMKVWLPKSCDLIVKNVLNPFNEFSLLWTSQKYFGTFGFIFLSHLKSSILLSDREAFGISWVVDKLQLLSCAHLRFCLRATRGNFRETVQSINLLMGWY